MPTRPHVTLSEIVQVAGEPLRERSLWALLRLTSEEVQASIADEGPGLLITPETILLRPGGQVEVLEGIHDDRESQFIAPEFELRWELVPDKEKVYVYSLGASVSVAADKRETSSLHQLLRTMISEEPGSRPSLKNVLTSCIHLTHEDAAAEINELVSLVLGRHNDMSSDNETDFSEENLDSELTSALQKMSNSQRGSVCSLTEGSTQLLKRRPSSRSIGAVSLARLSTSSVPPTYHLSLQEGLNTSSPQVLHRAVSLNLHSQDINLLACKSKGTQRCLPPNPVASVYDQNSPTPENPHPSPPPTPPHSPPPSSPSLDLSPPPSPPPPPPDNKHDVIYPEGASSPMSNAFQTSSLVDDLPPLPPPPLHPTSLAVISWGDGQPSSTASTLGKIDSLLLEKAEVSGESSHLSRAHTEESHLSVASFDYRDLENSNLNRISSASSSGEEFEFPPQPPLPRESVVEKVEREAQGHETRGAVDEALQLMDASNWESGNNGEHEDDKNTKEPVYAVVDKSKKTRRRIQRTDQPENGNSVCSPVELERATTSPEVIGQHALIPPYPTDCRPASGVYEEVEIHSVQVPLVDSKGYTEVGGNRGSAPVLEVGYSGTGSINKLRDVLGPEFSSMTGGKVGRASVSVPHGRRAVEVVMLNGKAVEFVVDASATTSQLYGQVVSSQSLPETHFFGLAVRVDRDDVFLNMDSKLAKYAPSDWITGHAPFTVFFRVKYYVENVSQLAQPLTRHLYYLQLRKDLMEGRMFCHEDPALRLAALAIQAERGSTTSLGRIEDYVPAQVLEKLGKQSVETLLPSMHRERFGLIRAEAELEFLKEAQKLPEYGMLFYRVAKAKHDEPGSVWLGFCVRGLVVFDVHKDVKTAIHHCAWRKTNNISYAHRKFVIELQDKPEPLVFFTSSYKRARYLLELSKAFHKFHLVWAKKSHELSGEVLSISPPHKSVPVSEQSIAANAVVEYPSPSRPLSVVEDVTSSTPSAGPIDAVRVVLTRGNAESFGFSLAGSTHSSSVYVLKVVAGGVSDGQLLVGDRIRAINDRVVESYQQTLAVLRDSGSQVTIDVLRRGRIDPILPIGKSVKVEICKEGGVLGVRIAGGSDKPYGRGLVRIKQVTTDTAGSRSGALLEGDIILQVNTVSLQGMTHHQAAEVILNAGNDVSLQLHRPSDPYWWRASPTHSLTQLSPTQHIPSSPSSFQPPPPILPTLPPPFPRGDTPPTILRDLPHPKSESSHLHCSSEPDLMAVQEEEEVFVADCCSEPNILLEHVPEATERDGDVTFEVALRKGYRGFGFRLDKAKSGRNGCGVFILAIDDNPAKASGRLQAGDEIITVNGTSLVDHTHHQCLQALRAVTGTAVLTIRRHLSSHLTDKQPSELTSSPVPSPPSSSPPLIEEHDY